MTVLDESSSIDEGAATVSHVDLTRIQRGSAAEGQHMPYLEFRVALERSPT